MIIKLEQLQEKCKIILNAVDSNSFSVVTDVLELVSNNGVLEMNVTNNEYFVTVRLNVDKNDDIKATVNASLFLKLISKITTELVEIKVEDSNLIVIGNGTYKIPVVYEGSEILKLPRIDIENVNTSFIIDGDVLVNINKYNTKQLNTGNISKPIQKMYYVDENGALTFTSGACVNKFTLNQPIKMLLNQKLVKMFNLFKGTPVNFSLGHDSITNDIIQTKVKFSTDDVTITALLSNDESFLNSFPASAIRNRAFDTYSYSIVIDKNELIQTIERLMLFTSSSILNMYSKFKFQKNCVVIFDALNQNNETINYKNEVNNLTEYEVILDLNDVKTTLECFNKQYVNISFGNKQAIVVSSENVYNVIPEITN